MRMMVKMMVIHFVIGLVMMVTVWMVIAMMWWQRLDQSFLFARGWIGKHIEAFFSWPPTHPHTLENRIHFIGQTHWSIHSYSLPSHSTPNPARHPSFITATSAVNHPCVRLPIDLPPIHSITQPTHLIWNHTDGTKHFCDSNKITLLICQNNAGPLKNPCCN